MLRFTREVYDAVVKHAYEGGDEEVCGVLAGEYDATTSHATAVHRATNVAETPQLRYLMAPDEQFDIVETIEDAGRDVVGFYHSHPAGPPAPSETDADRATWPDLSYVICALDGYPYVGAWRWRAAAAFEAETVGVGSDTGRSPD